VKDRLGGKKANNKQGRGVTRRQRGKNDRRSSNGLVVAKGTG